jgi:hypothetical protein
MPKGYCNVTCQSCGETFLGGSKSTRCQSCRDKGRTFAADEGPAPGATSPDVVAFIGALGLDFACGTALYHIASVRDADDPVAALTSAREWIDTALTQRGAA